jgi:hypothetical protein
LRRGRRADRVDSLLRIAYTHLATYEVRRARLSAENPQGGPRRAN